MVPVIPALGPWKQVLEGHITKGRGVDIQDQLSSWCYNFENVHKIFFHKQNFKYESRNRMGVRTFFHFDILISMCCTD